VSVGGRRRPASILPTGKEAKWCSALSVLPLPDNRYVRIALAALALAVVAIVVLAAIHVGDASAAKKDGWYKSWIEGYGQMWCKDV
jgi:hypothetical protein